MSDPFVHLRTASGYSLQYGTSHPSVLVAKAADAEMDTLAITDRDGLYGAIRFAKACVKAGIAPVIGADFAMAPTGTAPRSLTPARGGRLRDPRHPRVVALARGGEGWASLCRLTSAVHLAGERGQPRLTREAFGEHPGLIVMLGADSSFGRWCIAGRQDEARAELRQWCDLVGRDNVVVAATWHETTGAGEGSLACAAKMVALADREQVTAVVTNAVRMADKADARTADVLDAARRLVPLDMRHVDRRNAEGYLKSGKEMWPVLEAIASAAGRGAKGAAHLLAETRAVALRSVVDPCGDLGLGSVHLPEFGDASTDAMAMLRHRCEAGLGDRYGVAPAKVRERLDEELSVIEQLGYAAYFLTVAEVSDLIRDRGIRSAARGSGAGSLVNYLLRISGVDPLAHGLLMERFLSPLRQALPDIDIDVESARRTEIYRAILERFGGERVACMATLDTYRVRHAVRDVGAALSLPPNEIDAIAKAFPHIRARDVRHAMKDLPELRAAGLGEKRLELLFRLVESLDGLPRHVAIHPCGVILSDITLLDRTPVEASAEGFPMSQFDKDDVEDIGLLKLDILGIRMQSAMAHALDSLAEDVGPVDIDNLAPFDDPAVYEMIGNTHTLGCFQIESPGQRELVGKFGPRTFNDIIIDISLFRPGPMKTDMIAPFLDARNGWKMPHYLHPDLRPALEESCGVVVFHEQVIKMFSVMTGCTLAQGDEARRALGDVVGLAEVKRWFHQLAGERYPAPLVAKVWEIFEGFGSFGFCKAHAAAFALPTYQSAWLKCHYPAHFLAGILTHDPGMYPKRLLLEEARLSGIEILGLDINRSGTDYRVEKVSTSRPAPQEGRPDGRGWGIRLSLADVAGMSEHERARLVAGQPYVGLTDVAQRAQLRAPTLEKLVLAGGFDDVYGIECPTGEPSPTRRDLLLAVADLGRSARVAARTASRARGLRSTTVDVRPSGDPAARARHQVGPHAEANSAGEARPLPAVQLALDFHAAEANWDVEISGLPEMSVDERTQAELEVLGLDATSHVLTRYLPLLRELGVTPARDLRGLRTGAQLWSAGVKVATQTPPVRSGRRVVFVTLDDTTGPVDATFFEDAQGPFARTVFNSWLLLIRGELRRTGPRGASLNASGAWDLAQLFHVWEAASLATGDSRAALAAVREVITAAAMPPALEGEVPEVGKKRAVADTHEHARAGGMGQRRVIVHATGAVSSVYSDIKPSGESVQQMSRKLWHSSPGSSGR